MQKGRETTVELQEQATQQGDLQRHIQSVHEGIKYPCNYCDSEFTKQSSLQTHIQYISICYYKASYHGDLKRHIQREHHLY